MNPTKARTVIGRKTADVSASLQEADSADPGVSPIFRSSQPKTRGPSSDWFRRRAHSNYNTIKLSGTTRIDE
jgi:hypothetical protein